MTYFTVRFCVAFFSVAPFFLVRLIYFLLVFAPCKPRSHLPSKEPPGSPQFCLASKTTFVSHDPHLQLFGVRHQWAALCRHFMCPMPKGRPVGPVARPNLASGSVLLSALLLCRAYFRVAGAPFRPQSALCEPPTELNVTHRPRISLDSGGS